jgi:predicted  nucleic acid-binding Zn-ribbon protein
MAMLQSKMEELLSERARLTERITHRESMAENKRRQQGGWSKSDKVYKEYQLEIFRWNSERIEMEAKLSELDTETDEYEQTIKAVRGEQGLGAFSLSVRDHIEEIRQGRRLEAEGKERAERAEEEVKRIYGERRRERAEARGVEQKR